MTEVEFNRCTDPQQMLTFLRASGRVSERKLRLFAVACCRRIWHLLVEERSRQAIEVAERYADARATEEALEMALDAACAVWDADKERASTDGLGDPLPYSAAAYNVAIPAGWWGAAPAFVAPYKIILEATPERDVEQTGQCLLLRDLFGNPFRPPPTFHPSWLTTRVLALAQAAYADRVLPSGALATDRLAAVAAALEDAGCQDAELLGHLRAEETHVRGCHGVDLILGKE